MLKFLLELRAIKRWGDELRGVEHDRRQLLELLGRARADDAPSDAKALIVTALGRHSGRETITALADVLATEPDWGTRAAATRALGTIATPEALALLEVAAREDADRRVRENAQRNHDNPRAYAHLWPTNDRS